MNRKLSVSSLTVSTDDPLVQLRLRSAKGELPCDLFLLLIILLTHAWRERDVVA